MDITKHGWKCDICEKEFFDTDYGYCAKFKISIEASNLYNADKNIEHEEICYDCATKISNFIDELIK